MFDHLGPSCMKAWFPNTIQPKEKVEGGEIEWEELAVLAHLVVQMYYKNTGPHKHEATLRQVGASEASIASWEAHYNGELRPRTPESFTFCFLISFHETMNTGAT